MYEEKTVEREPGLASTETLVCGAPHEVEVGLDAKPARRFEAETHAPTSHASIAGRSAADPHPFEVQVQSPLALRHGRVGRSPKHIRRGSLRANGHRRGRRLVDDNRRRVWGGGGGGGRGRGGGKRRGSPGGGGEAGGRADAVWRPGGLFF